MEIDLLLVINCIYTLLLIFSYKYEWLHNTLTNIGIVVISILPLYYIPIRLNIFQILRAFIVFGIVTFMVIS